MRLASAICCLLAACPAAARDERSSPAGAMINLLKSGRVPKERQGNVVKLICQRGNADDLSYVFGKLVEPAGFAPAVRKVALEGLADAALTRKIKPKGNLAALGGLIGEGKQVDAQTRRAALRLAGVWKVESLRDELQKVALSPKSGASVRRAALGGLVRMGGKASREAIDKLTAPDRPRPLRYQAVAALAKLDVDAAAARAADVLAQGTEDDNPAPLVEAFLQLKGGSNKLAAALAKQKPPADVAKLALRHVYAVGRSDAALTAALSDAAGINLAVEPPTAKDIEELVKEVLAKGDAARGEKVFRRADLSCLKCHALNGAGGNVGPDLRDVGTSSPPDYLLRSVLLPDESIKEQFQTVRVFTTDGKQYEGIVADENDARLVLKDATGEQKTIPKADIDEREKGQSLMPKGLTQFMTRGELIDLARFLSELGKPGEYAVRSAPVIRRWRVLQQLGAELTKDVPGAGTIQEKVVGADPARWAPAYAAVSGALPLDDLPRLKSGKVAYLRGEIAVKSAGKVGLLFDSPDGLSAWIDSHPVPVEKKIGVELDKGRHTLILRVDLAKRVSKQLKVELVPVAGSEAEAVAVGGP